MHSLSRLSSSLKNQSLLLADNAREVLDNNASLLRGLLLISLGLQCALTVVSLVAPGFQALLPVYAGMASFSLVLLLLFCRPSVRRYAAAGLYLLFFLYLLFTIYLSAFVSPTQMGTSIIGLFCLMPLAFIDRSWRIDGCMVSFWVLHAVSVLLFKDPAIMEDDLVTSACFLLVGILTGEYMRGVRLENFEVRRQIQLQRDMDFLTGLSNRRKLFEVLEQAQGGSVPLTGVMMLDLDRFKDYNDRLGHQAGDACLRSLGELFRQLEEPGQLRFFRYGGEEFLALCLGASPGELAEKVRAAVWERNLPFPGSLTGRVTVSLGYAGCPPEGPGVGEADIRRADTFLYRAKQSGRNRAMGSSETCPC